jgi:small subunit ribosomal protein S16
MEGRYSVRLDCRFSPEAARQEQRWSSRSPLAEDVRPERRANRKLPLHRRLTMAFVMAPGLLPKSRLMGNDRSPTGKGEIDAVQHPVPRPHPHLRKGLSSGIIMVCLYFARPNQPDSSGQRIQDSVLMIRLARFGARKQPYYRVVVIEKERARNGRPVEVVGTYNPRTNPATFDLKRERIDHWVSKGAQCSDRVKKLLASPAPAAAASVA